MPKATNTEAANRTFTIQEWIIEGKNDRNIIKDAVEQFGISARSAKRYLKKAYEAWKRDETITIEERREARIADLKQDILNLDEKYRNTPQGAKVVLEIKKEISKLEDLYHAKKVQLSSDPDNPLELNQVVVFQLPDNNRD